MYYNHSSESLYYLQKSISAVNDDIADPSKQASDSTIATVASMANIEVRLTLMFLCLA